MAVTGVLMRLTWKMQGPTGLYEVVWHMRGQDPSSTGSGLAAVAASFWPNIRTITPTDVTMLSVQVQELTPFPLLVNETTINANGAASEGVISNAQEAAIVTWRTPLAGKRYRGRSYFPIPQGATLPQTIKASWITALSTMAGLVLTTFADGAGNEAVMGVYSRAIGGGGPVYNVSGWHQVTGYTVQPIIGAQRRRRLGRGA